MRSWAEVYIDKLISNSKKIHNFVKKEIIAVVKADAYGHSSVLISKTLENLSFVKLLAVATAEEGKQLRDVGIKKEILVLGGLLKDEVIYFNEYSLTPVISDFEGLELLKNLKIKHIHLKFDIGMHRLGFYEKDLIKVINFIKEENIVVEGIMSHFPSADIDKTLTKKQISKFKSIIEKLNSYGVNPKYIHIQNSAGLMYECPFCNMVRIGLVLYGEKPCKNFPLKLENIMYVKAKLISIKELKKGDKVSYGGIFKADKNMKIGVVSFGYADGLPRLLSNKGYVLINGKKANIIGNITMDMTVIDLSDIKADIGDEVVIIGKQYNQEITFAEVANLAQTIAYEIMCGISKRVKRIVK